ncbi:hypothetical protein B0H16DRAFT_1763325 [Mycena metata]|uniref:Uncharacterized protein n=1 Tax=Mycena metata TaxID=1033252 RepID=A0AAD7JZR6_9AGAR|nr:hypothetical protein B0H16DRAFT_1763325 [Mycena metata]
MVSIRSMFKLTLTACLLLDSTVILARASGILACTAWEITNVPTAGMTDITFSMTIAEADHISGYYFAQEFTFHNLSSENFGHLGYIGLQPRPDEEGRPRLHAAFSSFVPGTISSTNANCIPSADGGPGSSCWWDFDAVYGRTYELEVQKNLGIWIGTVVDTVTGERIQIGSWILPQEAEGIMGGNLGFVEWYPWNGVEPENHCAKLPYQRTIFGAPKTSSPGAVGTQGLGYFNPANDCEGQIAFSTQMDISGGVEMVSGFQGQTGY